MFIVGNDLNPTGRVIALYAKQKNIPTLSIAHGNSTGFKINGLNNLDLKAQYVDINKAINTNKSVKKDFLTFNINPVQKVVLIKINQRNSTVDNEKIGANFFNFIKANTIFDLSLFNNNIKTTSKNITLEYKLVKQSLIYQLEFQELLELTLLVK